MSSFLSIYLNGLLIIIAGMTILWLISLILHNASIVDPFWSLTFVVSAWYFFSQSPSGDPTRRLLVVGLVTIWGLRLFIHLLLRNWGKGEDFRYQNFRQKFGPQRYWWFSFFQVFLLQGILAWLVSAPLLGAQIQGGPLNLLDALAVLIWIIGFTFEAGSDWQLARFKADPANAGKLLTSGFWRFTRHPNYFGDSACWWAFGLFSLAAGSIIPALGALLMTFIFLRVAGVVQMSKSLKQHKVGYEDYARRTSLFIPLPPKKR